MASDGFQVVRTGFRPSVVSAVSGPGQSEFPLGPAGSAANRDDEGERRSVRNHTTHRHPTLCPAASDGCQLNIASLRDQVKRCLLGIWQRHPLDSTR